MPCVARLVREGKAAQAKASKGTMSGFVGEFCGDVVKGVTELTSSVEREIFH